uniref:Uncharacterized protein n=1 Tax=Romanomermis culicivorax TaxID=13658 RepID=A0A915ISP7_ROMCU
MKYDINPAMTPAPFHGCGFRKNDVSTVSIWVNLLRQTVPVAQVLSKNPHIKLAYAAAAAVGFTTVLKAPPPTIVFVTPPPPQVPALIDELLADLAGIIGGLTITVAGPPDDELVYREKDAEKFCISKRKRQ